jgi:hypothetical protein
MPGHFLNQKGQRIPRKQFAIRSPESKIQILIACQAVVFEAWTPKVKTRPATSLRRSSRKLSGLGPPGFEPGTKGL